MFRKRTGEWTRRHRQQQQPRAHIVTYSFPKEAYVGKTRGWEALLKNDGETKGDIRFGIHNHSSNPDKITVIYNDEYYDEEKDQTFWCYADKNPADEWHPSDLIRFAGISRFRISLISGHKEGAEYVKDEEMNLTIFLSKD